MACKGPAGKSRPPHRAGDRSYTLHVARQAEKVHSPHRFFSGTGRSRFRYSEAWHFLKNLLHSATPPRRLLFLFIVLILGAPWCGRGQSRAAKAKAEAEATAAAAEAEEARKTEELLKLPNFVLILADDLGWDDLSPFGHESIRPPNLQRLANGGMRFDRAFVTASSCSPSRASILTGRFPHQTDAEELHRPIPKEQVTFVEKLKEKGYWTGAADKWHLGDQVKDLFDKILEVDESGLLKGIPFFIHSVPAPLRRKAGDRGGSGGERGCKGSSS